jgi:hypothetical protein
MGSKPKTSRRVEHVISESEGVFSSLTEMAAFALA